MLTNPQEDVLDFDVYDNDGTRILIAAALRAHATEYLACVPAVNVVSLAHEARKLDTDDPLEPYYFGEVAMPPTFYARGRIVDAYGRLEAMALEVEEKVAREIEPVSDIFDVDPEGWRLARYGYKL